MARRLADKLPADFREINFENTIKLDTEKLFERFSNQSKNLFEYLMEYKFPKALGEIKFEERVTLFVEIAMEYEKLLDFRYRLNYIEYTNSDNKKVRLGYTIILPLKKEQKKAKKELTKE
jgi:hypothetical protein